MSPFMPVTCTSRSVPRYPAAIRSRMKASPVRPWGLGTIMATRSGSSRDRSYMRWASRAFIAMRACVRTCLPASNAARVTGQCR